MQRNFEPMRKRIVAWQRSEITDVTAKVVVYEAYVEGKMEAPKHLARTVHDLYFEPKYEEFRPRTIWSLSNAFTSALKELEPIPQFKATAKTRRIPRESILTIVLGFVAVLAERRSVVSSIGSKGFGRDEDFADALVPRNPFIVSLRSADACEIGDEKR